MIQRHCPSPIGTLTLVADRDGLVAISWPDDDHLDSRQPDDDHPDDHQPDDGGLDAAGLDAAGLDAAGLDAAGVIEAVLDRTAQQLGEYFAGTRREFDLPLAPRGTPFQVAAWQVLRTIPYGETMTYREQAAALGDPAKARAVGSANGRNPLPIVVPCHRVCATGGGLGGFTGGLAVKSWLLDHERRTVDTAT